MAGEIDADAEEGELLDELQDALGQFHSLRSLQAGLPSLYFAVQQGS